MPIDIDGYDVLGAISRQRQAFPAIRDEASKAARSLVVKQLKAATLTLEILKVITSAIGFDSLELILDMMPDSEIKSLLGKMDKFNTEAKTSTPRMQRKQILDLAKGQASPISEPVTVKPAKTPRQPKTAGASPQQKSKKDSPEAKSRNSAKRQPKPPAERAVGSRSMQAKQKV